MDYGREKWQYAMLVKVLHGQAYGHRIELETRWVNRESHAQSLGVWKGLGVPEDIVRDATCRLTVVLTEHLVTRYGVQGELPMKWGGEPDPF